MCFGQHTFRHYRPSADDTGTAFGRGNHRQRRLRLFMRSLYANIQFWHWIAESIVLSAEHLRNFLIEESHATWYFEEMEKQNLPEEMIATVKDTLECNPQFRGHVVSLEQIIMVMVGSIVLLGVLYLWMISLREK